MTAEERRTVLGRSTADIFKAENLDEVRAIYDRVRRDGDIALVEALERYDGVSIRPDEIRGTEEEIAAAVRQVPDLGHQAGAAPIAAGRRGKGALPGGRAGGGARRAGRGWGGTGRATVRGRRL